MEKPTHVEVTAADGRLVPIAPSIATGPGGTLLLVRPGEVHTLPNSSYVRRRIAAGDLVLVEKHARPKKLEPATKKEEG